jgi:septum site-determining protein MinD
MGKVLGVISIKGGVGKTTLSSSLAANLVNHYGKKVLLVDANYSAPNLGLHMDIVEPKFTVHDVLAGKRQMASAVHKRFGVDVVPGSYVYSGKYNIFKLRSRLNKVKDEYDFIILDSSPSLNEEVLSTMLASDNLFVVSTPDYPTLSCSMKAANLAKQRDKPISGIVINKVRHPRFELKLKEVEESTGIPVVARIPDDKKAAGSLYTRIPMTVYDRHSEFSREVNRFSAALTGVREKRYFLGSLFGRNFRKEQVNRQVLRHSFYKSVFESAMK